jgi:hypothetical protein
MRQDKFIYQLTGLTYTFRCREVSGAVTYHDWDDLDLVLAFQRSPVDVEFPELPHQKMPQSCEEVTNDESGDGTLRPVATISHRRERPPICVIQSSV